MIIVSTVLPTSYALVTTDPSGGSSLALLSVLILLALVCIACAITASRSAKRSHQAALEALKVIEKMHRETKELKTRLETAEPPSAPETKTEVSTQSVVTSKAEVAAAPETEETDEVMMMAVISAAIHSVIGDKAHRIISVRQVTPGWALEGRRQIFSSHRMR